ncbi:MAG TPA: DUF2269 family protein [bacterium]|nr:DUF2269 family protein [bacterium]
MKTRLVLIGSLTIMAGLIIFAAFFKEAFIALLYRPALHPHVLFVHIVATTLFFANAVLGMLWESRSLASGRRDVILHTYSTVAWLDAHLSSPLIIISVMAGLMLSFLMGDPWQIRWLSTSFLLFMLSGVFWIVSDIPTQYKVKRLIASLDPADETLPVELTRLLKLRLWISLAGVAPLVVVFVLMVYKPGAMALPWIFTKQ